MAKTKPIGVRFDEELLNSLKDADIVSSPQKALNLYEETYLRSVTEKVAENNKPENKAKKEAERNGVGGNAKKEHKQPLMSSEMTDKPNRSDYKDGMDYSIALAEWKEKQNAK